MAKRNKTRYALLGLLSAQPMSGYDVRKSIQQSMGLFWNESFGQIYPALKTLVDDGLATKTTEAQTDRPDRIVYAITNAGEAELRKWLVEPVEQEARRMEILLKLFLGHLVAPADNLRHLARFRALQAQMLQQCREAERHIRKGAAQRPDHDYVLMTARYGVHASLAQMNWCDEAIGYLQQRDNPAKRATIPATPEPEAAKPMALPFLSSNPFFKDYGAMPPIK